MSDDALDSRRGVRLRAGLPESNGLAHLADELINDTSRVVFFVGSLRTAAVTHNTENDSKTASLKLLGLEADLLPEELQAIQLVLDRARVRRTGEQPMFDTAGQPDSVLSIVEGPPTGATPRRGRRRT